MLKLRSLIQKLLLALVLLQSTSSQAIENEYMLKAGFLYNFARFGQWQDSTKQTEKFTLCSPDQYFIHQANATLQGRVIQKVPIQSKQVALNQQSLEPCSMLFITSNTVLDWQSAQLISYSNIMLVGETESFISNGGHIRFFITGGKVRFEISPQRLKDAGISMSSKVLRLARIVEG
jgi:hypothetical protein